MRFAMLCMTYLPLSSEAVLLRPKAAAADAQA